MSTRWRAIGIGLFGITLTSAWAPTAEARNDFGTHQEFWQWQLGVRAGFVGDSGYDPFAEGDGLVQFSLGGGRTVFSDGPFSLAAVALGDFGGGSESLRNEETDLSVLRLTLGPEARYHFFERLYVYGRVAPGALRSEASLRDSATGTRLSDAAWVAAVDGAVGIAFQVAGKRSPTTHKPRFWIAAEGGYGWAMDRDVELDSSSEAGPVRIAPLELETLALRGPMFRVVATATF